MTPVKPTIPKIARPALDHVSARPRLFRGLRDATRRHAIVWVSAPAGSGKTTLAASFLAALRRPCLWYQLDAGDADPATFFYYLQQAARQAAPRRRRDPLPLLTPEYALGLDAYTRRFFEKLGGRLRGGTHLVLDNYQEVPEEAPLHALLPAGFSALPGGTRVVVLSRAAPPAPFARLVAEGAVAFLEGGDLDLDEREIRGLARARVGKPVDAGTARALRAQTGGWVAGTVLLLEAPSRPLPARRGEETVEQQVLFDYFAAEIFDRAPEEIQRLLLATAILPEVDVAAAETMAGAPHAGRILSDLVRRNYFTLRLEGARPRYRLHPLFREFLLERARRSLPPPRRRELARLAAASLVAAGRPDDAASLLAAEDESDALAELVRAHAPALARQGRFASIEGWLRALSPGAVERDPWLAHWLGVCRAATPDEARAHFDRAYRLFRERGEPAGALVAWAGFVATFFYVWNEFAALDPWIAGLEELRSGLPAFPSPEVEAQVTFGMLASLMWRQPGHPKVGYWATRAEAMAHSEIAPEARMQLAAYAVFHRVWWKGDQRAAAAILDRMRPLLAARDVTPLTQMLWYVMQAACDARVGDRAGCFAAVERGLEIARESGVLGLNHLLAMQGVYGALAAGDVRAAERYHEAAAAHLGPGQLLNAAHLHQLGAWIALCSGDAARAEERARRALPLGISSGAELARTWVEHTMAHVLVERGKGDEAEALLERCLEWTRMTGNPLIEHHVLLSLAWAHAARGDERGAVDWLREGMRLGREHGYRTHPWIGWRRDVMARLAALALRHGVETRHAVDTIRAGRLVPPDGAPEEWPWPVRIRMLGAFELWRDGVRVAFPGKVQRRPLDLLRALVALGGEDVPEDALVDRLWPDSEADAAAHALETTAYRLRRLLGSPGSVVQRDRRLTLDPRICWVDALALARRLAGGLDLVGREDAGAAEVRREAEGVLSLYRGPLVPAAERGPDCATPMRERLRARLSRFLDAVARRLDAAGEPGSREAYLARAREVDPAIGAGTAAEAG